LNTSKYIVAAVALVCGFALTAPAQEHRHGFSDHARGVIDRTQDDLRRAAEFERHRGKEVERYENAQRHLSDFDREVSRGHFDKDKLDTAIDDVKNVVEHNTLNAEDRDSLRTDLADLRGVRAEFDSLRGN
jgi:hypothetical protein